VSRVLASLLWSLVPAVVLAASGEQHVEAEHHGIPWSTLAFSFINTAIFLWVFFRYLWPFVCGLMGWAWTPALAEERRRRWIETLDQAARAKEQAERLRSEWEGRLAALAAEVEGLRTQARAEIARERDQILAAARAAARTIERDAQRSADQEVRQAEAALREEIAAQALAVARRLADERLTAADRDRFVVEFLKQVAQ
jgi:F-type H+-transporting ATPase subunit b